MWRWVAAMGACALAGCSADPQANAAQGEAPAANAAAPTQVEPAANGATAAPAADAPASDLGQWLVGAWAFGDECATDFYVRFQQDGTLDNSGDIGRWSIDGDAVTETITERFEMGEEQEQKLDPPQVRHYRVERVDAGHGRILIDGRKVAILRC